MMVRTVAEATSGKGHAMHKLRSRDSLHVLGVKLCQLAAVTNPAAIHGLCVIT